MRDGMVDKRDKLGSLLVVNGIAVRETAWVKSVVKNKYDPQKNILEFQQVPNIYFIKCLFEKGEEKMNGWKTAITRVLLAAAFVAMAVPLFSTANAANEAREAQLDSLIKQIK
jgi:hypothetical protein